ncbi:hypothetical protein [Vibrio parahaemolyticus]|uniref:hypothetical protein n=1 Tax=Vibrio parahaemolyticus TaxID=670 RepID=UPI00387B385C|nr:hypothetical protein [Vibrio parahaemolyticus]HCG6035087.1 hypothetical protein [Vibrio parahaemolyticus]
MKTEQYNEDKFNWCKSFLETALGGVIDIEQLQNSFVQDLWVVAGAAFDVSHQLGVEIAQKNNAISNMVEYASMIPLHLNEENTTGNQHVKHYVEQIKEWGNSTIGDQSVEANNDLTTDTSYHRFYVSKGKCIHNKSVNDHCQLCREGYPF